MSNIYLVALLISNASGNVESIEAVDAVTQGGCTNLARQMHLAKEPIPSDFELRFTCGSREALDTAVTEHHCKLANRQDDKGVMTTTYACDASLTNKVVSWMKSVL